ncbi:MAG TPA: hypothetical protein VKX45_13765 [Bryobacteraceae bacterium]|jgi:hypothetical protein|nr:hypothetical protein [Bryobacteraceae bacterium]
MNRLVIGLLCLLAAASSLLAQGVAGCTPDNTYPWALWSCVGQGCSYGYTSSNSGFGTTGSSGGSQANSFNAVGCLAVGQCNTNFSGRYMDVSWYQYWTCNAGGYVTATGSSSLNYTWDGETGTSYSTGMIAAGQATVGPAGGVYFGWDSDNCDGSFSYSGPYSFSC